MKTVTYCLLVCLLLAPLICGCSGKHDSGYPQWSLLPSIPDVHGVAGSFAGVSGGQLFVAGGANFPGQMPWEGGTKVWHDEVYALASPDAAWRSAGRLPRPLAYGVALSIGDGVLCIGGGDGVAHRAEVFVLRLRNGEFMTEFLDPLPIPLAQSCGAAVGDTVYVACGATEPGEHAAVNRVFTLCLGSKDARWREIEPLPGKPRILPVAASVGEAFCVAGGAALEQSDGHVVRTYLRDAWSYSPGHGWRRLADMPKPSVGSPSPAPVAGSLFLVAGGDDGSLVGYRPPENHPGFPGTIMEYDAKRDLWSIQGTAPAPRATAPVVPWDGGFVIPSGEVRPGVRSPEVWALHFGRDKERHSMNPHSGAAIPSR